MALWGSAPAFCSAPPGEGVDRTGNHRAFGLLFCSGRRSCTTHSEEGCSQGQLSEQVTSIATLLLGLIDQVKAVIDRQPSRAQLLQQSRSSQRGQVFPCQRSLRSQALLPAQSPQGQVPVPDLARRALDVDPSFGQLPSPAASQAAPQDAMQAALLQQSQAVSTLVGDRRRGQRGRETGEAPGSFGSKVWRLLPSGDAGRFSQAEPVRSLVRFFRRLVGAGVDVPLLRTFWGLWVTERRATLCGAWRMSPTAWFSRTCREPGSFWP